jgi:hypothetical protein
VAFVNRLALICAFTLASIIAASQQTPAAKEQQQRTAARAEILVLGSFHMANRGHDIYNMHADDVLAPKRQSEIAQLIEVLKKFNPTKIAIEADLLGPTNPTTLERPKQYAEYLAGKRQLLADEVEQIGFRLAKELGHKTIYPVNADYDFPYQRLIDYAKATGRSKELDEVMSGFGAKSKEQGEYLASHTMLETLLWVNADERIAYEAGLYSQLTRFGEVGDWAGADLNSDWYRRNMRIYSNILQLIESPNERVLVIYGSGHLDWLQHNISTNPDLRLRKLSEFAK